MSPLFCRVLVCLGPVFAEAILGVWLICAGLQGYLAGLGRLDSRLVRVLIGLGGLVIAMPQLNWVLAQPPSNLTGLVVGLVMVAAGLLLRRFAPSAAV